MNVTKHVLKGRQLHNEGCLGMVPAEQGEYPKVSNHERITENNDFIMDMQTGGLLERILDRDNMRIIFQNGKCMSWQIAAKAHGEPH